MYDETKHWEECTICGQKEKEANHNYTDNWYLVSGKEQCYHGNYCNKVCNCGYSYVYHRPCVWNGSSYLQNYNSYNHYKKCSVCKESIMYEYYYNSKLYNTGMGAEQCTVNKKEINCTNIGKTCEKCKHYYSTASHRIIGIYENQESLLTCRFCNQKFGTFTQEIIEDSNVPITHTIKNNISLSNGATLISGTEYIISYDNISSIKIENITNNSTKFLVTSTVKSIKDIGIEQGAYFRVEINGISSLVSIANYSLYADQIEPTISNIKSNGNNGELTEWSKTKPIIITGTENYCKTVSVEILDDQENTIFEGTSSVTDGSYSISCIPEIECDATGKTFIATVKDSCNNSISQEFTIAKVDAIPPKPISGTEILGDWAKSKNFTFKATDKGIGNVQVAFNDIEDLGEAILSSENEFSREYKFTGDVYKPKTLSVLYQDGLGNTKVQKITINKLDNTAPTITNGELHNNILNLTSHDRHEKLGEGSGVIKYRYLASTEKIENPKLNSTNTIEVDKNEPIIIDEIYKVKYIYAVAEDLVGNTSEIFEIKVPELVLTSSVNLNTQDRKGEIILDWSTYDLTEKYFVIYRKQYNQSNWETIVPLTNKLTANTYTDKLGNDKAKPDVPSITITGDANNNNINVTASSKDNGTKYIYYIEAYDSTGTLISKSN